MERQQMVLDEKQFEWLQGSHEKLQEDVTLLRIDVAALKVKAGVWGLLGGCIPVVIMLAYMILKEPR